MNRKNFYFEQILKENEVDAAFDDAENALFDIVRDLGLYGLMSGGYIAAIGGTPTCNVSAFVGYDKLGRRLSWAGPTLVDFTNDTAGSPTIPAAGKFKWITLVARHGYLPSDARTDGNGDPINFVLTETVSKTGDSVSASAGKLQIIAGVDAATINAAVRPSVGSNDIIIADLILNDIGEVNGGSAAGVSFTRVTRIPSFVISLYDANNSYSPGDLVRWTDGEIYQAIVSTIAFDPSMVANWKLFRGSPDPSATDWTTEIFAYRNRARARVAGFDHFGFPAGRILHFEENWLNSAADDLLIVTGFGEFGSWRFKLVNPVGGVELIKVHGPYTTDLTTRPRGPIVGVRHDGGTGGATVLELCRPLVHMDDGSIEFEAEFTINGGSALASTSSIALGFSDGTLYTTGSTNGINTGTAFIPGAYICKLAGQTNLRVISLPLSLTGASTDTGVVAARDTRFRYKVVVLGAADSGAGASRVVHFLNGVQIGIHSVNMTGVNLTPFIRMSANGAEACFVNVGRLWCPARLEESDTYGVG